MKYGRYQIVKELGRGSMGVVYEAHDPQFDRSVALKVMRQDRVASEAYVKRFLKEARAIGRLSHQHIVTAYDAGEDQGSIYIAMEFVEGPPLNEVLQERKFDFPEIVNLGIQVAETLHYAQKKGVVHRDIKPSNIILQPGDLVKITDFGIAHIEDVSATLQTQDGEVLGTPAYMSPEQVLGKSVDGRSDLFSLGIILYELSTGERPFGTSSKNIATIFNDIVHTDPNHPLKTNPETDPALAKVIMKCLNKDPDQRFQTGKELAEALRNCIKEKETLTQVLPAVQVTPKEKAPGKRGASPLLLALCFIVLVGIAAAYVYRTNIMALFAGKTAVVKMQSNPQGADIFVDGASLGKTPLDLKLPYGKHSVRISLSGYKDWEDQIQLDQAKEYPLLADLRQVDLKQVEMTASLNLTSSPPGAEVFIEGTSKGKTPLKIDLGLGKHLVRLSLPGYRDWEDGFEANEAGEYPLQVQLEPVAGLAYLKLASNPPGAEVIIDGASEGRTPTGLELPLGKHGIRMTLPDHETWEDQVELTDSKEYPVEVELKPVAKMASLKVLSTPSGAEVSIDGTPKGTTPSDMVLPLGAHSVQISLPEYEKWEDRIQLEDAKEITVELQPLVVVYSLDVSSAPSGAEVTVDEKPEGTTPLNLKMRPGTYMIKVHLSEHQEWKKNLQIKDKDFALKADLIPLPKEAYINASSSPNGATVYVDGKPRGSTPLKRLSVSPGSHKIRLSLGGYNSSESKVTLKASQEHSIDVTLTKVARGPGTGSTASSGRTGSSGSPGSSGSSGGSTGNGWVIKDAIDK